MRIKKHIALVMLTILFFILAICMRLVDNTNAGEERIFDSKTIKINEVCSDYFPTTFAETQTASDWIELYNASDNVVNLDSYYLSDEKENIYKCQLPSYDLEPGTYYVIHSKNEEMLEEQDGLNFGISAQGETIYLSNESGLIDIVNVPSLEINTSWSRLLSDEKWAKKEISYGITNEDSAFAQEKIEAPYFSADSGFYDSAFELELMTTSGSRIYYTLDGSEPNESSILYQDPIMVESVSDNPNVYSARNDFNSVYEGCAESVVEKINVVRAIAIDSEGKKSNVVTNSYIVKEDDDTFYGEMYTVSIVSDPYNLFDYEEGIYVNGKVFDEFVSSGGDLTDWIQANANHRIKGKRSERPASIEVFDEMGSLVLDREVGIRIHGGTTRGTAQKSFSVYAREMYDGKDTIEGLFGEDDVIHKFFIYTNREGTKLRDVLLAESFEGLNVSTQTFKHCNVFLDGEYWGVYLLAEEYDEYYFENHYGISRENIWIHEGAMPPDVREYLDSVADKSDAVVYDKLCEMIDVQSFIDYYATMIYLNNNDWLFGNSRCYRSIESGNGKNEDGKWRWAVWDSESTMYNSDVNTFYVGNVASWQDDVLAQALMEHEEFRKQFVTTYMNIYNSIWQEENILPIITMHEDNISESYNMHCERWGISEESSEYIDKLKNFFSQRDEYAFKYLEEEFNLNAEPTWLVLLSNEEHPALFQVNNTDINMPAAWWQGLYFAEYPVELSVEEEYDGNVFVGWYTEADELISTEKRIIVDLQDNTTIIYAKFARK